MPCPLEWFDKLTMSGLWSLPFMEQPHEMEYNARGVSLRTIPICPPSDGQRRRAWLTWSFNGTAPRWSSWTTRTTL